MRPSKKNGYIQLSAGGANHFATLQTVLLWSKGLDLGPGRQVSHLCDKPACLISTHITIESAVENNSRKNYGMVLGCFHCEKKVLACKHTPSCITYVKGFSTWEDFVARGLHKLEGALSNL